MIGLRISGYLGRYFPPWSKLRISGYLGRYSPPWSKLVSLLRPSWYLTTQECANIPAALDLSFTVVSGIQILDVLVVHPLVVLFLGGSNSYDQYIEAL